MRRVKSVVNVKILIGWFSNIFCRKFIVMEESYVVDLLELNCMLYIIMKDFDVIMVMNVMLYVMYIN